jgi:phosphinothricin acetyltransferase
VAARRVRVCLATARDAAAACATYAPVLQSRAASFEIVLPTVEEMAARMIDLRPMQPWLVAGDRQGPSGYAWARPFAARAAYE